VYNPKGGGVSPSIGGAATVKLKLPATDQRGALAWLKSTYPGTRLLSVGPNVPRPRALIHAWTQPAGQPALGRWLRRAARDPGGLLLLVNDTSRRTPTAALLERLQPLLERSGAGERMRCLVATGTHAAPKGRARESAGAEILGRHWRALSPRTEWHDADSPALVPLPVRGRKVARFHPWIAASRFVLAIGSCEPHYFAGITGAHKSLTVGVMGRRDIERDHALALSPRSQPLRLSDNPVHRHQRRLLKALAAGRSLFAINVLIGRGGEVAAAAAGTPERALSALAPRVRKALGVVLPAPADLIVAQVDGPLGRSLYQADKGIKNVEAAVRSGGAIVLLADCRDGIGTAHFWEFLRRNRSLARARRTLRTRGYRLGDHKALRWLRLVERRRVRLLGVCPGLEPKAARAAQLELLPDLPSALSRALAAVGPESRPRIVWVEQAGEIALRVASRHTIS